MASSSIRVCGAKSKAFRLTPLVAALLLVYPGIQARHAQADQSPANTPIANTKNTLPELGRPSDSPATLTPSQKGVTLDNRFDGKRLVVSPEYSDQTGLSLGGIFAFPLGDSSAGGLLLTAGNRKKELLFNAGFQMGDAQRLVLTLGQQRQHLNIGFLSGTEKTAMTQNNGAVSYQFRMEHGLFDSAEINAYLAVTPSRDLADKSYAVDTAALYELWNDPRRVAGGRVTGLQGRLAFTPLPGATFKLGAGGERQEYDYLTGKQSTTRATGSAEWVQCLAGGYQAKAGADVAVQNRYSLGLERSMDGGGLFGASFTGIRGKNGAPHDNQLKLTWSYTLDSKRTTPSRCGNAAQAWGNLLDQVAQRPGFLPAQVVAKLDTSAAPVRQIAVDKTALPAGSSVNTVTGAITTPLGIVATGIAGVTLNAAPFANTGQFALSGNSLVIDPNQIIQPAVGVTDTYVVTVNISGGGTSLVTVVVSRGSVRIDSITIVGGADVAGPTVGALNATSGVTTTGFTANWTKSTDNRDAQNQLQYLVYYGASGADFTSVANVKANGTAVGAYATDIATKAIGGLTEYTTYKYTVMVKDTTGNESIYVAGTQATPDTTAPAITNTNVGARTVQTVTAGQYIEAAVTEASNLNASAINGANYTVTLDDGFGTTVVVGAANYTVTKSGVAPNYTLRITFDNAAAVPGAYGGGTISIVTANNTIRDASSNQIPVGTLIWSANIVP
ncbi:MAG: hypothetical protein Q7S46_11405 [Gallionella sp.]|nr:hypothetical protein [Gallionella sp.]